MLRATAKALTTSIFILKLLHKLLHVRKYENVFNERSDVIYYIVRTVHYYALAIKIAGPLRETTGIL